MRDVLGIIAAGVVACLVFVFNLMFVGFVLVPTGLLEHGGKIAFVIVVLWSLAIPIAAAVLTIRIVGMKERKCDVCGQYVANDAVDWMQRTDEHGEPELWVPTHANCTTDHHRYP